MGKIHVGDEVGIKPSGWDPAWLANFTGVIKRLVHFGAAGLFYCVEVENVGTLVLAETEIVLPEPIAV